MRFPEFTGEWEKYKLGEIAEIKTGPFGSVLHADDYVEEGTPIITTEHFKSGNLPINKCRLPQVSTDDYIRLKSYILRKNDIVFSRVGSVDINAHVEEEQEGWLFSGRVLRVRLKDNWNTHFVHWALSTSANRNNISQRAVGQTMPSINTEILGNTEMYLSKSKQEQCKIADLLNNIDQRISTQNKIIEDLQSLKKAITNSIIDKLVNSSELFPFADTYTIAGEGGTPDTTIQEYYKGGVIPFIKIDDLNKKYLTENKDYITELGLKKSSAWLVPTNSIIYSNGATIGALSINTYQVATKQGILGIVPNDKASTEYLYYLMSSSYFTRQVNRIITHGTMATAYLKDISKIKVPIPTLQEQERITKLLKVISKKEEIEQFFLSYLQRQKSYFLQAMFI